MFFLCSLVLVGVLFVGVVFSLCSIVLFWSLAGSVGDSVAFLTLLLNLANPFTLLFLGDVSCDVSCDDSCVIILLKGRCCAGLGSGVSDH